jgi:2-keto-4-pentenoate hydratase/2-oxohepta-3-ene-1,7-dioic acid hydratase in catechol pathway
MKIGFYNDFKPCIVVNGGVIDVSMEVGPAAGFSPQAVLEKIITDFASLKPAFERAAKRKPIPLSDAKLRAPVPRPGKVLCGERNYMEGVRLDPPDPLRSFFKSPDAVIGPGEEVVLPRHRPRIFNHEAELGVVIGKRAKEVSVAKALDYVFGYTTAVDVSARQPLEDEADLVGRFGKSFDTFLPLGPSITTADEIPDPNKLQVRYWVNGQLRQDYNTSDMEHSVAFFIATLSHVMTLMPGDLILAGTNHARLGPLQNGDTGEIEIERIGRSSHKIVDPLAREWPLNLRDPKHNEDRRRAQKSEPNSGTWPFQKKGGKVSS